MWVRQRHREISGARDRDRDREVGREEQREREGAKS